MDLRDLNLDHEALENSAYYSPDTFVGVKFCFFGKIPCFVSETLHFDYGINTRSPSAMLDFGVWTLSFIHAQVVSVSFAQLVSCYPKRN